MLELLLLALTLSGNAGAVKMEPLEAQRLEILGLRQMLLRREVELLALRHQVALFDSAAYRRLEREIDDNTRESSELVGTLFARYGLKAEEYKIDAAAGLFVPLRPQGGTQ